MTATTVPRLLAEQVATRGDADWVVCDDERLTYAGAERRSAVVARGLLAAGVGRASRVGLLFPTGLPFVIAWLAVSRIGATSVPISTFSTATELHDLLAGADVEALVGVTDYRGHDYVATIETAIDGLDLAAGTAHVTPSVPFFRHVWLTGRDDAVHASSTLDALVESGAGLPEGLLPAIEADVEPSDRLVIVHTSGSTSAPKAVIHQHGSLTGHLANLNPIRGLHAGTRLFSNSPLFWVGGLAYNVVGTLVAGATLLCSAGEDPGETLDFIERERPELTNGFVASIASLVAHPSFPDRDFSSIRSGNLHPLLPDGLRPEDPELRHNMLGTTETGSVCLMSPDETDQPESRRGSFGKPVPGLDARVVDPETLTDVPVGTVGELWFRGPALMDGYYGRERFETFTPDGWYRTGDLFVVDDDGFFYFKGRGNDMIKTGGANVSPREVEAAIREVTGGLAVLVVGVPDAERGQLVGAVILAEPDAPVDLEWLRVELRARLSAYKVPRVFVQLPAADLPMMSSGKPDMPRVVELFRGE
jgi:acyl-CoA synthetase (AMP-forming)/AMP-acid ligase II